MSRHFLSLLQTDTLIANTGDSVSANDYRGGPPYPREHQRDPWKWNPARPDLVDKWTTPMLIIHSDRDYRCSIDGGLAAFDVLQLKGVPSKFLNFPDEVRFALSLPVACSGWFME